MEGGGGGGGSSGKGVEDEWRKGLMGGAVGLAPIPVPDWVLSWKLHV